jgi:5'-nucleotidase
LTGQQVVKMLEQQWQRAQDGSIPSRKYLELGLSDNISYTYETYEDAAHPGEQLGRVTSVWINGQLVKPTDTYRIGTFSFLAAGGDNFWIFQDSQKVTDTGFLDWEGWIDYVSSQSAISPLSPDFTRRGVAVTGQPTSVTAGQAIEFDVAKIDVPSLGSAATTSLAVTLDGVSLGTATVASGAAHVSVTLPAGLEAGAATLTLTAAPSGTTVRIPLTVTEERPSGPTDESVSQLDVLASVGGQLAANGDQYTAESFAALEAAVAEARSILATGATPTQGEVDSAIAGLSAAIAGLTPKTAEPGPADTSALNAVIAGTAGLKAADYTADSWAAFTAALQAAQAVVDAANPTAAQVAAAAQTLGTAIGGLAPKTAEPGPVDTSVLGAVITEAAGLKAADYTAASWQAFSAALTAARTAVAAANPTAAQVAAAARTLAAAIAGLTRTSSGGADAPGDQPSTVKVVRVKAAQTTLRLVKGKSAAIGAIAYTDANTTAALTWSSSKKAVATVNAKTGKIKAKKAGTTVITATAGGVKAKITVKVVAQKARKGSAVTSVKAKVPATLTAGATASITGTYSPATAVNAKVAYKSSKASVVAVDKAGTLVAKAAGKAKITVTAGGKSKVYTITVK